MMFVCFCIFFFLLNSIYSITKKNAEESLILFRYEKAWTRMQKQIVLAECYEILDKAIYIHERAVMNFPMQKFMDENESHPYYNDELRNPSLAAAAASSSASVES